MKGVPVGCSAEERSYVCYQDKCYTSIGARSMPRQYAVVLPSTPGDATFDYAIMRQGGKRLDFSGDAADDDIECIDSAGEPTGHPACIFNAMVSLGWGDAKQAAGDLPWWFTSFSQGIGECGGVKITFGDLAQGDGAKDGIATGPLADGSYPFAPHFLTNKDG